MARMSRPLFGRDAAFHASLPFQTLHPLYNFSYVQHRSEHTARYSHRDDLRRLHSADMHQPICSPGSFLNTTNLHDYIVLHFFMDMCYTGTLTGRQLEHTLLDAIDK